MGHPLRLEILQKLRHREFSRAADLAGEMDVPANSLSYHLRMLARAGLIEEAPEHARDRRDRVWRIVDAEAPFTVDASDRRQEYIESAGQVGLSAIEWLRSAWLAEVAVSGDPTEADLVGRANMLVSTMRLTREEAMELGKAFDEVLERFGGLHRDEQGRDLHDTDGVMSYRVASIVIADR